MMTKEHLVCEVKLLRAMIVKEKIFSVRDVLQIERLDSQQSSSIVRLQQNDVSIDRK